MRTNRLFHTSSILAAISLLLAPAVSAKSALWKISSDRGTMYVQGSAHVLKAENYPLAPAIEQAYSNATTLVLEVDMADMTSPATQQLIMGKAMLTQPDTLKTVLTPPTYAALEAACADAGLPIAALQPFKPWFATISLALVKMQTLGVDAELGLDKYFFGKATTEGKKVIGLETVDFQIALFDSLAEENPDDFVNRSLVDLKLLETDLARVIEAWETGELAELETLLRKSFDDYPKLYDKFITARNKTWVKKLSKLIQDDGTCMVVVGAGHLPGEEGVINLLKKKGFAVEQL